jgi:hypothetical protein
MWMPTRTIVAAALAFAVTTDGQQPPRTFDAEPVGTPPSGLTFAAMRQDAPGAWFVRRTGSNGYLVHETQKAHRDGFGIALTAHEPARDLSITVRLRLPGGTRAAGVVWRYQDVNNHYQVILDLVRRELAMYRVVSGNRIRIEDEEGLDLDGEAWHTLRVVHDDARIRVSLGGIRVFEDEDRTYRVGRLGLLAAGDADVWFDDLRVDVDRRSR